MIIRLGDTIRYCFGTADSSGAAANADSLPTVVVLDQGTPLGYLPAVVNKATGVYEVAIVASGGNGFIEGHEYSAYVTATVGGTTGSDGLASFIVRTTDATSVYNRLGAPAGASVSADIAGVKTDVADVKSDTSLFAAASPKIDDLHKIGIGRWKVQGTQLLLYDTDNETVLYAFDLKDDTGEPSGTRIFERMPVV